MYTLQSEKGRKIKKEVSARSLGRGGFNKGIFFTLNTFGFQKVCPSEFPFPPKYFRKFVIYF